jgi:hypothetical protein
MIINTTKHFIFHIRWISALRFLYFNLFSAPFYITFLSDRIAVSFNNHILSVLFLIIMYGLTARTYLFVPIIPQ